MRTDRETDKRTNNCNKQRWKKRRWKRRQQHEREEEAAENIRLIYNKIGQRELSSACLSLESEREGKRKREAVGHAGLWHLTLAVLTLIVDPIFAGW